MGQISKQVFKLVVLGDPGVGKTSIRKRYMGRGFSTNYLPTMGADFAVHNITRGDTEIEFQIWDLAGQANFDLLLPRFIAHSDGVFFVFDLSRRETFVNIANWIKKFKKINEENLANIPMFLVGNKSDLENREVSNDDIQQYGRHVIKTYGLNPKMLHAELSSAKTGSNIKDMFEKMIDILVDK